MFVAPKVLSQWPVWAYAQQHYQCFLLFLCSQLSDGAVGTALSLFLRGHVTFTRDLGCLCPMDHGCLVLEVKQWFCLKAETFFNNGFV